MKDSFVFRNKNYFYVKKPRNTTWLNERCIELALAYEFINKFGTNILEVGNVTRLYWKFNKHFTLDLYEKHKKLVNYINKDIIAYETTHKFNGILAISTCEHTKEPVKVINKLLNMASKVLVTVPLGYCEVSWKYRAEKLYDTLDLITDVKFVDANFYLMHRINSENEWQEINISDLSKLTYEQIYYNNTIKPIHANLLGIWIKGY